MTHQQILLVLKEEDLRMSKERKQNGVALAHVVHFLTNTHTHAHTHTHTLTYPHIHGRTHARTLRTHTLAGGWLCNCS